MYGLSLPNDTNSISKVLPAGKRRARSQQHQYLTKYLKSRQAEKTHEIYRIQFLRGVKTRNGATNPQSYIHAEDLAEPTYNMKMDIQE